MAQPGRRTASRRSAVDVTAVLGVLLPILTVGALLLVRPAMSSDPVHPPVEAEVAESTVVCPSAPTGAAGAVIATTRDSVSGDVSVRTGNTERGVPVRSRKVASPDVGRGPFVVAGAGRLAPGLMAGRFGTRPLAASDCGTPEPATWFTGAGAGAGHNSVLELVNPDDGPAVADVTLYGRGGPIDEPTLRGVTVPGHGSTRLDLGRVVPRRSELALEVVVSRGRLGATVLDQIPELGAQPGTADWLTGQTEPDTEALLLGLPPGPGSDILVLSNPGDDEARVDLKVVTTDAAFAPEGLDEITVAPGSVQTVELTDVLRPAVGDGAVGVSVDATVPVTASLRSLVSGDLSHAVSVVPSAAPVTTLVPTADTRVVLARADGVGVATVTAWSAGGERLAQELVELKPGGGAVVDVPAGSALVRVSPARTAVSAAALVTGRGAGATVVPFRNVVLRSLVPDVRPGLP